MGTTIRAATAGDYPAVDALFAAGDTFHAGGAPEVFRPPVSAPARPREIYDGMLDPGHATFVAEREGRVVGFVHALLRASPPHPGFVPDRYAAVEELVVAEGQRGAGVGRALLARAEDWAREQGASAVTLTVWEFPGGALPFYERLGYRPLQRRLRKRL